MSLFSAIKSAIAGEKPESSSETAKQRLHLLLISDRASMNTPDFLPQLRLEIIEVLRKYVPIARNEALEIKYENTEQMHIIEMSVSLENENVAPLPMRPRAAGVNQEPAPTKNE